MSVIIAVHCRPVLPERFTPKGRQYTPRRRDRSWSEPVNIWTVDKATIGAEIRQRNALRKSALLPLLDEQQESEHACWKQSVLGVALRIDSHLRRQAQL